MRTAVSPALALTLALGCSSPPIGSPDTGADDGGTLSDARALDDAYVDPSPDPVLPEQSWIAHVPTRAGSVDVTFRIDRRAQSGSVRVVAGAYGHGSTMVFDILPGGHLVGRSPLVFGHEGGSLAGCDEVWFEAEEPLLDFVDRDGDGIEETLMDLGARGALIERHRDGNAYRLDASSIATTAIQVDQSPPTFDVDEGDLLQTFTPGLPLVVRASEPIAPSFFPTLHGPVTRTLTPDDGPSATLRWRTETWDLPPGHYTLTFEGSARDLAGLEATSPPSFAFDATTPYVQTFANVDASVVGYASPSPLSVMPGDATHDDALLATGRLVFAIDLTAGSHVLEIGARILGPTRRPSPATQVTIFAPDDTYQTFVAVIPQPQGVPVPTYAGPIDFSSTTRMEVAEGGLHYLVIDAGGGGCGGAAIPDQSVALDRVFVQ